MERKRQAYDYLKNAIIHNGFPPGAPLREVELSALLHMSRSPIREALRELESEGVVVSYPNRGTFVSTITPYDVEEIYELRTLLEVWALEKGFERITQEELDRWEAAFSAPNEPFDWDLYHATDRAFHQMFISKSGSRRAAAFAATLDTQVDRIRYFSAQNAARSSAARIAEHLHIIQCIRAHDLRQTRRVLREHLRNVSNAAIETCKMMGCEHQGSFRP